MKKLFALTTMLLITSEAFADDWRMRRFDLDSNGFVTQQELRNSGCLVRVGLFKTADKNGDGVLSKRELRKASDYIIRRRCPRA